MWYAIVAIGWVTLALCIWQRHKANRYGRHAYKAPAVPPAKTLTERVRNGRRDPDDLLGRSLKTCVGPDCGERIHVFADVCRHCATHQPNQNDVATVRISTANARRPVRTNQEV